MKNEHRRIQPSATDGLWCVSLIVDGKVRAYADRLPREVADQFLELRTNRTLEKRLHERRAAGHQ